MWYGMNMIPLDNHSPRREKGQIIAQLNGQVRKTDETAFAVKSQSGKGEYQVIQRSQIDKVGSVPRTYIQ